MKNNFEKQMKTYLREISRSLPWNYPQKKDILLALEQNIQDYLTDHPTADWSDVLEQFGTASEVANSYLDELSDTELALSFQKRKKRNFIIIFFSLSLLIMFFLLIYHFIMRWQEDTIIIEETSYTYYDTEIPTEWKDETFYGEYDECEQN